MRILVVFTFRFNFGNYGSYSDSFGHVIITQIHIVWRDYLLGVECHPMQSHVFCGFWIHDPFANIFWMHSILCYKYKYVNFNRIFDITFLLIFYFIAKLYNVRGPVFLP